MTIERFIFGPFETNTYVVSDEAGNILLIDPACFNEREQRELLAYVNDRLCRTGQSTLSICATHGHLDHLWGARWATEQWHTPVLMHEADIPMAQAMQQQYNLFGIRMTAEPFELGPMTGRFPSSVFNIRLLHTPGHTPGSVCLYFPEDNILFSGDTLFRMGYGRTDLPGGSVAQLIGSLERLFELPAGTRVFPGHGDYTTIGAERR